MRNYKQLVKLKVNDYAQLSSTLLKKLLSWHLNFRTKEKRRPRGGVYSISWACFAIIFQVLVNICITIFPGTKMLSKRMQSQTRARDIVIGLIKNWMS